MPKVKLAIHDTFLDAFSTLPKRIQKKVREMMRKFRENPASSALNYEKIASFIDQSLRTIRVDQKYRAIIQAPNKENTYMLLWVDNHDEAMAWAENKIFEQNKKTQAYQVYDKPSTLDPEVKPAKQEKKNYKSLYAHCTDEYLQKIGTPPSLIPLVRKVENLNDLDKLKGGKIPKDVYEYLYYIGSGIPLGEVLEEIEAGVSEEEDESLNYRKHVFVLTEDDQLEEVLSGDFEKWKVFLHPSQRTLAYKTYRGATKVTGGAGTGKTVCAIHRVKFLLSDKDDLFEESNNQKILFTTFTNSLTSYIQKTILSFGIDLRKIDVMNIDRLINYLSDKYLRASGVIPQNSIYIQKSEENEYWQKILDYNPSSFDTRFLKEEYNDVILRNNVKTMEDYLTTPRVGRSVRIGRKNKREVWNLVSEFQEMNEHHYTINELCNLLIKYFEERKNPPYSSIICDELQDFSELELKLLRSLVDEGENDMFLVGDPFQNIYGRHINFSRCGINVRGRRSKKLKLNYRCTEEIRKQAMTVIQNEKFDDFDGEEEKLQGYLSLMHGNPPTIEFFNHFNEELQYISNTIHALLEKDQVKEEEICIAARTNTLVRDIKSQLKKSDIRFTDLNSNVEKKNAVYVSTFHNLKGHEFKHLFVSGVSSNYIPYKHYSFSQYNDVEKEDYIRQEKSLLYVVLTRAIQSAIITGSGSEYDKIDWL